MVIGVRLRSALAAAAVVGLTAAVAAAIFIATAKATLTRNVDAAASQRAAEVVSALRGDDGPDMDDTLRPGAGDRSEVQVLTAAGTVVASSSGIADQPALSTLRPAAGQTSRQQRSLGADPFRILAVGVDTPGGRRIVLVAESLQPVIESAEVMTETLAWGMPVLVVVVGLATFMFVGRSLRPVESIRQRVATITAQQLHSRVPVPAARDEITALAETMNAMLDRLEAAADAQRRFVADASHELRSPLATVQVGLDYLATRHATAFGPQLQRLQAETARLGHLVADLLLLARVDENGVTPRSDDVDLDDLAYAERDRIRARHPGLRVVAAVEPVRVRGDAGRLERALRNLGDNAARHASSMVTLTAWTDAGGAHLTVDDDGPGIDPADRQRVFERFVRLDGSRAREDGGSGLGLPISKEIVAGHGGGIRIEDSESGARFHIRLPLPTA
jgi:signal transduction histidine kinase